MKVIFHRNFYVTYTSDPAAGANRMEGIVEKIWGHCEFVEPGPASEDEIAAVHAPEHIDYVKRLGLYDIAALAAGGAIKTAATALMNGTSFGLIRPPGHHASADGAWGYCYFNNMAVALEKLKREGEIEKAFVLDIDLHFGDGTVNIFKKSDYVTIYNPEAGSREDYLEKIAQELEKQQPDIIGISAGFDNHRQDWGGLLETEDYQIIGKMVRRVCQRRKRAFFGILEGGYNQRVLGDNVFALLKGMEGKE